MVPARKSRCICVEVARTCELPSLHRRTGGLHCYSWLEDQPHEVQGSRRWRTLARVNRLRPSHRREDTRAGAVGACRHRRQSRQSRQSEASRPPGSSRSQRCTSTQCTRSCDVRSAKRFSGDQATSGPVGGRHRCAPPSTTSFISTEKGHHSSSELSSESEYLVASLTSAATGHGRKGDHQVRGGLRCRRCHCFHNVATRNSVLTSVSCGNASNRSQKVRDVDAGPLGDPCLDLLITDDRGSRRRDDRCGSNDCAVRCLGRYRAALPQPCGRRSARRTHAVRERFSLNVLHAEDQECRPRIDVNGRFRFAERSRRGDNDETTTRAAREHGQYRSGGPGRRCAAVVLAGAYQRRLTRVMSRDMLDTCPETSLHFRGFLRPWFVVSWLVVPGRVEGEFAQ